MDHDPLVPKPMVGVTRGLIRHRDKKHVGSIWLNRDTDDEVEDPQDEIRNAGEDDVVLLIAALTPVGEPFTTMLSDTDTEGTPAP